MRKITEIYEKYDIMPNLQLHQFRVAAVAQQICESLDIEVDTQSITAACLLHDMGNIIKAKLGYFPEFEESKNLEYWKKIQSYYISKYGSSVHDATLEIVKELKIKDEVSNLVDSVGFTQAKLNKESSDFNKKIVSYADMRVKPHGISSLAYRLADLRERYSIEGSTNMSMEDLATGDKRDVFESSLEDIEKEIFSHSNIKPEDINDESVKNIIEELKNFEI